MACVLLVRKNSLVNVKLSPLLKSPLKGGFLWYNDIEVGVHWKEGVYLDVYLEPCKRIWEGYQSYASLSAVIRSGHRLVGIANSVDDFSDIGDAFTKRGESDLEHQAKVAWLCSVFVSNFPSYFGVPDGKYLPADTWLLFVAALCHDSGEVLTGDVPDDGRYEHDLKAAQELDFFKDFVKAYGFVDQEKLLTTFRHFQKRDSLDGKALFALDKVEFVLSAIFLEKQHLYGYIDHKMRVTPQDEYFMKETGSNSATDVWAAHLRAVVCNYPQIIAGPILTLVDVAIQDTRGERFPWWNKGIKHYSK